MAGNFTTAGLPRPVIVQPLDYAATLKLRLDDIVGRMRAAGIPVDAELLQTDPIVIAAQAAAYGDMHYVDRLNDMARVTLLASFAEDTDLDLHAVRAGLERGDGESDEALRERIRLAYKGKSAAGPDDYYRSRAFETDPVRVKDVAIRAETRNSSDRVLILSVLTSDNGGVATQDLLDELTVALNDPSFRQRSVTVEVIPSALRPVDVQAIVYLYPQAVQPADGAAPLRTAFAVDQRLGFDLTRSYIEKYLHIAGAQRVELVGWEDQISDTDEAIALGTVSIEYRRVS